MYKNVHWSGINHPRRPGLGLNRRCRPGKVVQLVKDGKALTERGRRIMFLISGKGSQMKRGKEILSVEGHIACAAEIDKILDCQSRLLELVNGKVPVKILDQLLSFRGMDKAVQKFRSALEDELACRHPREDSLKVYYSREDRTSGSAPSNEAEKQEVSETGLASRLTSSKAPFLR